jgi:hypothetical protein
MQHHSASFLLQNPCHHLTKHTWKGALPKGGVYDDARTLEEIGFDVIDVLEGEGKVVGGDIFAEEDADAKVFDGARKGR